MWWRCSSQSGSLIGWLSFRLGCHVTACLCLLYRWEDVLHSKCRQADTWQLRPASPFGSSRGLCALCVTGLPSSQGETPLHKKTLTHLGTVKQRTHLLYSENMGFFLQSLVLISIHPCVYKRACLKTCTLSVFQKKNFDSNSEDCIQGSYPAHVNLLSYGVTLVKREILKVQTNYIPTQHVFTPRKYAPFKRKTKICSEYRSSHFSTERIPYGTDIIVQTKKGKL